MDGDGVVEDQLEIIAQEVRQGGGGPGPQHIDPVGGEDRLYRPVEALPVGLLQGHADLLDVRLHHRGQDLLIAQPAVGYLDALHRGEPAAHHLLERLLHAGIPVVAQFCGEAHHRGLADMDRLAQPAGRHEGRLVIGVQYELSDGPLPLGEGGHPALYRCQNIPRHPYIPTFTAFG